MKKLVGLACASIAVASTTFAFATDASAATATTANRTPGCVTQSEYKKAKKGMTPQKVKSLFSTNGKREARADFDGYVSEIRSYKTCSKYSAVSISFDKKPGGTLRLTAKSAIWVY